MHDSILPNLIVCFLSSLSVDQLGDSSQNVQNQTKLSHPF